MADQVEIKPVIKLDCKIENSTGTYKLFAIVHHFGDKANGHYITDALDLTRTNHTSSALNFQTNDAEEQWYRCDDESISKLKSPPPMNSNSAYVLFYTKIDHSVSRAGKRQRSYL